MVKKIKKLKKGKKLVSIHDDDIEMERRVSCIC